jgi:glucose uptake protein GlcU
LLLERNYQDLTIQSNIQKNTIFEVKMNFDPFIPTGLAIFIGLLAASWWGSWSVSLKYLGDYPLEAFYLTLFGASMILVWGVGFILDGGALVGNIRDVLADDPARVMVSFICGVLYVVGLQISLRVIKVIGLAVTSPIQSTINLVAGTTASVILGGIPETMTMTRVVFAAIFLLAAINLTMSAGRIRNKAQGESEINTGLSQDPKIMSRSVILLILSSLFIPAYTIAISFGLKSITQPNGMAVMPFMAVLCTGSFTGVMFSSGITLTRKKQWGVFREVGLNIHKWGLISSVAHYGGNIIHTFATRNLSAAVSWPLGVTSGLWTQIWGLVYGEFKGSPRLGYLLLFGGFLSYVIGVVFISAP